MFNPMWDNEVERIAVRKCSPLAMRLHGLSDLCSLIAVLWLILGFGVFALGNWWWSVVLWILGRIMYRFAFWKILKQHEFKYDEENITASWYDKSGVYHTYTHQDLLDEQQLKN